MHVVKRSRLVAEHNIVRARNTHDEVAARRAQQQQQVVHVVLVGFGVVGVANVAAHRHAQHLAAKMVFQTGTDNLLAVIQILRPNETDNRVHEKRLETPRDGISARFQSLLVNAEMRVRGKTRALSGLEIHHVISHRSATKTSRRIAGFFEYSKVDAETFIRGFCSRNRLKNQVDGHAALDGFDLRGNVRQHAALRGNRVTLDDFRHHVNQGFNRRDRIGSRIDSDDRVAAAHQKSVENRGRNAARIVGRVIRLQSHAQSIGQADGVAETRHDAAFARDQN